MLIGHLELITNRQTWSDTFTCVDSVSGAAIDISSALVEIFVRNPKTLAVDLQGTSSDGHVSKPTGGADGVFILTFSATEVRKLCAITYDVAVYITIGAVVTPVALVTLPVKDGIKS